MQNSIFCQLKGHETEKRQLVCTYKDCNLNSKWLCASCLKEQIHDHKQINNNHLMGQTQFEEFLRRKQLNVNNKYRNETNHIQFFIKELKSFIQEQQQFLNKLNHHLLVLNESFKKQTIQDILNITNNDYLSLNNQQIDFIVSLDKENIQFNQSILMNMLKELTTQYQNIQKLLSDNNQQLTQVQETSNEHVNQYVSHLELQTDKWIYTSQISKNEQYLLIGHGQKIEIISPSTKQMLNCIEIQNSPTICKFTDDTKFLICGDHLGYIYCYDVNKKFQEILQFKLHSQKISDLIILDIDRFITCSNDKSIIQFNKQLKKQELIIENAHNDYVNSIEYDNQNNIIISCSRNESIRFHSIDCSLLFEKQKAHTQTFGIEQLQLMQNNRLLSASCFELILWEIDYINKSIIKSQQIKSILYNFSTIKNKKLIILINEKFVEIIDDTLMAKMKFNHNIKTFACNYMIINQVFQGLGSQILKIISSLLGNVNIFVILLDNIQVFKAIRE